jgi:hypothetical protein
MALNPVEVVGGIAVGEGVGGAVQAVVEPQLQALKNDQWSKHADVPPDVMALAEGVAHGQLEEDRARVWAAELGFGDAAFSALVRVADTGPGVAYAFELWRRGKLGETAFRRALKRAALEEEWIDALVEVKQRILSPQELAVMVQRGVVPDPGYLPVGPPSGRGKVTPMPVAQIDTEQEAAGSGYDHERMAALTRIIGLPASPDLAARMVFRGIIDKIDFYRAIAEGNTRNEWRDPLFEGFREILTAHNYAELELRGYLDRSERLAGTRKHGMSDADSDLLYDVLGRSIPVHQIETGEARGGVYNGPIDHIPEPFLASLRRGNLRREYFNLAYANRFTYPSGFMIRGLAQDGELTQAETHQILLEVGWSPHWATTFSERWAGGTGAAADPNVKKAQTHLWTTTHRSFVASEVGQADVEGAFDQLAIPAVARPEIIGLWMTERDMVRKQLTAAQLKKAYTTAVTDPATGQAWTRFDVLNRLTDLGYSFEDAETFLDL